MRLERLEPERGNNLLENFIKLVDELVADAHDLLEKAKTTPPVGEVITEVQRIEVEKLNKEIEEISNAIKKFLNPPVSPMANPEVSPVEAPKEPS